MTINDHFRWPVERRRLAAFERGDAFQITWVGWHVHSFTHVDMPRHMLPDGLTTSDVAIEQLMGNAAIIDLSGLAPRTAITEASLQSVTPPIDAGDIVLVKTCWDEVQSTQSPEFWRESPFMTRGASQWLLEHNVKAVGFDFPQDFPIRGLLDGEVPAMHEMVTHDILLRNGVILIEYVCNLRALTGSRGEVMALPLKLPNADGAPARVVGRVVDKDRSDERD